MKIKNKITKFKRKALKNIFGAFSLSTALFIFQACYGTNQDFEPELSIRGTVRAENTAEPIPGIKVSLDKHRQYDFTDENGQFVIYTEIENLYKVIFEDVDSTENGLYTTKDTILENINVQDGVFLDIILSEN